MQTDAQLFDSCRRGDNAAWEALVHRYQRLIYAIPRRAGLSDDEAADVFQEVFTTLFRKLNDIEDPERLHAWLVTTAKRKTWKVITANRKFEQRGSGIEDEDDTEELERLPDEAPLPDELLLQLEEQHRIRSAITELDERCAKLITMLFYHHETAPSYDEIAVALGTKPGSIGPTRARCLEKMLKLLEKT